MKGNFVVCNRRKPVFATLQEAMIYADLYWQKTGVIVEIRHTLRKVTHSIEEHNMEEE